MIVDYEEVLDNLGIDYEVRGPEALGLCPMHFQRTGKEDHSPSWSMNIETGQHMCFSCHYKGSLLTLIADVNGFYLPAIWGVKEKEPSRDYAAAEAWLANMTDVDPTRLMNALQRIPGHVQELPPPPPMNEARLALFTDPPQEQLDKRRISLEAAQSYEILWDPKAYAWILVIRKPDGKLMGWQEKGTVERTFKNRPPGISKKDALFGYRNVREDVVYLVESPIDCARLHTAGFPGAVAICGSLMSEEQVKLIRDSSRVVAAFDHDEAGMKASRELHALALKYGLNLSYFNYGETGAKDPGDLSDEDLTWGIEHAKSFLFGESAYV